MKIPTDVHPSYNIEASICTMLSLPRFRTWTVAPNSIVLICGENTTNWMITIWAVNIMFFKVK